METGGLKSFAGEARRQLLSEVRARLELVLAEGSTQRREFADVVRKLESAVEEAGGGEAGRVAVVDRVAYTWFNRIVALRFMDANGFTDVGVVSPAADRPDGQPEVLVDAKRGVIDTDVVAAPDAQRIAGLLNGSVTSADPESEAFGLLLAAYCRFWNRSMPFMFEHSADYTELLMPGDLLSDESVIARAASVLTPDVCADVEVIGWLYQFYIAERKDEVFAGFKKGKKAGAAEIPAATQLFTPDWIVRYLVENSLGRLWMLNRPDSNLVDRMDYYVEPVDEETDFLRIESPEEIKVMDPACGSGHMLTYAFDLLFAMYEEDGYNPADIPALILSKNLYGTEIDQRAGALAAFALTMKARTRQRSFFSKHVTPNICVLEPVTFTADELNHLVSADGDRDAEAAFFTMFADADIVGALIRPDESLLPEVKARVEALEDGNTLFDQDLVDRARQVVTQAECLTSRYHVVVANPPYMGSKNMTPALSEWAKTNYPHAKSDLFAMFIERCMALSVKRGVVGMITMQAWMFLGSFHALRLSLLRSRALKTMLHLGSGAFDSIGGEVVSTTAFTLENLPRAECTCQYLRLTNESSERNKIEMLQAMLTGTSTTGIFAVTSRELVSIPGAPIAYWLSKSEMASLSSGATMGDVLDVRAGISTGRNAEFILRWYEVSSDLVRSGEDAGWVYTPHNKGGEFIRWYGNQEHVLKYSPRHLRLMEGLDGFRHDGVEYYFREHVGWSKITSGGPAFRYYPRGFTFDSAGLALFGDHRRLLEAIAFLNSPIAERLMAALNPTLNTTPSVIKSLPYRPLPDSCMSDVLTLLELAKTRWDSHETSMGFGRLRLIGTHDDGLLEFGLGSLLSEVQSFDLHLTSIENRVFHSVRDAYGMSDGYVDGSAVRGGADPDSGSELRSLISYAVGCMFGRYSLDEPGLILANQGDTLQEYLARVPEPSFMPDEDNVIPVLADDWFDDDIVERFRLFLRVAFGEEHFEENLRFVEESLGKDIRRYFLTDFYRDHVQRYKKRPIYWMFSSPKGTFNALIYMHRYNPSTVSTVLNEYLREFQAKLDAELANQSRIAGDPSSSARDKARAEKESDKIRKMLAELRDYEHDVLYPLASRQISIDLDDGVKANYPKFGTALKKIPGLEATND